ncbi:7123_t:CDS:1, partial [Cetraspora pellucida]
ASLNVLLSAPLEMSNAPLNMYSLDNTQATRNYPIDEFNISEFFQYSKEKYESKKMRCGQQRKPLENFSLDEDDTDDTSRYMQYAKHCIILQQKENT